MKRSWFVAICLIALAATSTIAAPNPSTEKVPAFPRILANARYVYVFSYDGDQFDPNLLPEDQAAIGAVQKAIQEWGKLFLVYQPSQADIIILVTSRPSEDLLAVYDARPWPSGNFLWRVMGRDGLQAGETPLVTQFEKGFESVQKHSKIRCRPTDGSWPGQGREYLFSPGSAITCIWSATRSAFPQISSPTSSGIPTERKCSALA